MRYLDRGEEEHIMDAAPALIALALTATQYTDAEIKRLQEAALAAPRTPRASSIRKRR
jgi:hypothetical protein